MSHTANPNNSGQLTIRTMLAYSSLTIPITAVGLPLSVYIPPLYATQMDLNLATVGAIFMLARIWDVVTDPLLGIAIDRFPSHWGRRKHWIVAGMPVLMVSAWFIYLPITGAGAGYLLFWLFVLYFGFTLIDVAHKSWASDLAISYNDRSRLFGWREGVNIAGSVTVLLLPALAGYFLVNGADEFDKARVMGLFLIISLPITTVIVLRYVPDRSRSPDTQTISFGEILPALKKSTLMRIFIAEFLVAVGLSSTAAMFMFVAKWVFELESLGSIVLIAFFVSGMVAAPIWVRLSSLFNKHIALITACGFSAAAALLYLSGDNKGSTIMFFTLACLGGLGFTGPQILLRSMVADVVDQEELRSGKNRAGLYFGLMSTVYKLGGATAIGVSYSLLDLFGFDPASSNSPEAIKGLMYTFVFVPALFSILTVITMWKYPLTRAQHDAIRAELGSRKIVGQIRES